MILIDTSVWIDFFRQREKLAGQVNSLLNAKQVVAFEPVFAELLYGVRDQREMDVILSYWKILPKVEFGRDSMIQAALIASSNDHLSRGIGLIDGLIIQAAVKDGHLLWTLDRRIQDFADPKLLFI
jgi:predicted nucleic acid-binding protein